MTNKLGRLNGLWMAVLLLLCPSLVPHLMGQASSTSNVRLQSNPAQRIDPARRHRTGGEGLERCNLSVPQKPRAKSCYPLSAEKRNVWKREFLPRVRPLVAEVQRRRGLKDERLNAILGSGPATDCDLLYAAKTLRRFAKQF